MKIKSFNFLGILLLLFMISCGCCKETTSSQEGCKDCLTDNFFVTQIGDCGFVLMKHNYSSMIYKPIGEIAKNYHKQLLNVKVVYKLVNKGEKCNYDGGITHIEIIKIEKL